MGYKKSVTSTLSACLGKSYSEKEAANLASGVKVAGLTYLFDADFQILIIERVRITIQTKQSGLSGTGNTQ